MNVALIAHDKKKELMIQFCSAYCGILSKHSICATETTGKLVSDATGLKIERLMSGLKSGEQRLSARVAYNEIDLVIFFRDPHDTQHYDYYAQSLLRLCDTHNIPVATNLATAEALVFALDRGDLGWRDIVNPKNRLHI